MGWRALEMLIGLWIVAARSVLAPAAGAAGSRLHDVLWGVLVIVAAAIACLPRGRVASIAVAAAAIELFLLGRFGESDPRSPVAQSYVLAGLTLLMIAPLPTRLRAPTEKPA